VGNLSRFLEQFLDKRPSFPLAKQLLVVTSGAVSLTFMSTFILDLLSSGVFSKQHAQSILGLLIYLLHHGVKDSAGT
jgi:hypothetical protein